MRPIDGRASKKAGRSPPGETPILVHSSDSDGDPIEPGKEADPIRDLLLPPATLPLLPGRLSGMEELGPPQPELERVLHQAAQGFGETRQGPLLDHRPVHGVHVRGGKLSPPAPGLPSQVPGVEAPIPPVLLGWGGAGERAGGGRLREPGARRRGVRERLSEPPVSELSGVRRDVRGARWRGFLRLAVSRDDGVQNGASAAANSRGHVQDDGGHVQDGRVVRVQERGDSGVQERAWIRGGQEPGTVDLQDGGRFRGEGSRGGAPGLQGERGYDGVLVQSSVQSRPARPRLLRGLRPRRQQCEQRGDAGYSGADREQ